MLRHIGRFILLFRSCLFRTETVREQVADLPRLRLLAVLRYMTDPSMWRVSTHPLFDGEAYLGNNEDVARAEINPLLHYLVNGDAQDRDPHPLFSVAHYRAEAQLTNPRVTTLEHYLQRGAKQGLTPYPLFDYDLYRDCTGQTLPNSQILSDLASKLREPDQQRFLDRNIEKALKSCSRSAVVGSLIQQDDTARLEVRGDAQCDVVIPVKNSIDWLDRCLSALVSSEGADLVRSIILVDDACSEQSRVFLAELSQRDRRIVMVRNDARTGFAAACNFGFQHCRASHVLFLNSDCLVNSDTIERMLGAFSEQPRLGLACAVANNAANATLPMSEGCSFVSMNRLVKQTGVDAPSRSPDICTTVGHCLMVSRKCYEALGGMDESWGLGYGEESDLHLRARSQGYLGALVTDSYVYHFGGGTFRYETTRQELQRVNHARFIRMWGDAFISYSRSAGVMNPIPRLEKLVQQRKAQGAEKRCDVLFVLPCIVAGIGGVHVVLDLCNHLIMRGVDARVLVLGALDRQALVDYAEPLYVNPYHIDNVEHFLTTFDVTPSVVVTTLYSTVPPAWKFAKQCGAKLVNFVQGFEVYFDSGKPYELVRDTYFLAETSLVTSNWLAKKVKRKALGCDVRQLPLGVNRFVFYPQQGADLRGGAKLRVGLVLRASVDKGQFVLRELVDLLGEHEDKFSLTVFKPDDYPLAVNSSDDTDTRVISLPAGRQVIADALREVDVFVDASLHEGYGLFPLEAMACGACVVASDSGGVTQYLTDGVTGRVVVAVNKPEAYLQSITELYENRALLAELRSAGIETASGYDEFECFDQYWQFFAGLLGRESEQLAQQACGASV